MSIPASMYRDPSSDSDSEQEPVAGWDLGVPSSSPGEKKKPESPVLLCDDEKCCPELDSDDDSPGEEEIDEVPADYDDRCHYKVACCQCFPLDRWDLEYEMAHSQRCYRCILLAAKAARQNLLRVQVSALAVAKSRFKRVESGKEDYDVFLNESLGPHLRNQILEYVMCMGQLAAFENFLSMILGRRGVGANVKNHVRAYFARVNRDHDLFDYVD